jgi:glyoxylase-like metal-dependent hydrolase (beta-lactamase superfamily II)
MRVETLAVGELQSNCHIVINEETKSAVLVDCGGEPNKILQRLNKLGLTLSAILLTHGHYDHFEGVAKVQELTNCKVYISQKDSPMLTSNELSLAKSLDYDSFNPVNDYITINDGDTINEVGFEFKVIATEGHTIGCVCYLCQDCLFTGDTLFRCSMGRTDFPTGNYFDMQKSLKLLYNLKGDYNVYCGHNGNSTLQFERRHNPCMLDAVNDDFYLY